MKIKKLLCIILSVIIVTGSLSTFGITSFGMPSAGNQTYSVSALGNAGKCGVSLRLSGASAVSGSKVIYYVDRYDINTLSDLGNIYSVDFAMDACVLTTSISTTKFDISNKYIYNSQWFSVGDNVQLSDTATGTLLGNVPSVGTVEEFTISANISVNFKYGNYALSDNCSVSATIRIEVVDSSALRSAVGTAGVMKSSCWTQSTWDNYSSVVDEANALLDGHTASQASMDSVLSRLNNARNALVHDGPITECEYCRSYKRGNYSTPISYRDYVYGNDTVRQSMDLFLPGNVQGDTSMIVYLHGGGWIYGDKSGYTGKAYEDCQKYGVATLAVNYRYASPSVSGHDIMDDVQAAVTKAKELAAEHGMNLTKMMTTGGSAGGHLALLYAYSRKDVSPVTPVCVISKCGPTNLTNKEYLDSNLGVNTILYELSSMCGFMFNESNMDLAYNYLLDVSPVKYVNSNTVPTVICHGMKDITVPFSDAQTLDTLLTYYNVPHHFLAYPNTNHALDNLDKELDPYYYWYSWQLYDQYIETYLLDEQPSQVHDYTTKTVAATCTTDGYTLYTCSDCGSYYVGDVVKASHTAGDWQILTPATYTSQGERVKQCAVCGEIVERETLSVLTPEFSIKNDAPVTLDGNIIKNVPQGMADLSCYFNLDGCTVEVSDNVAATGSTITIKNLLGATISTFTASVSGDLNGDGYVDAFDVALSCEYINTFTEPEDEAFMNAADIFDDGYLDATDLAYLIYIANFEAN